MRKFGMLGSVEKKAISGYDFDDVNIYPLKVSMYASTGLQF
jgi:hypothetical protein